MENTIKEIVTIYKQKNGKIKISQDAEKEANMYRLLRTLGFCKSKLNGKRIFYKRQEDKLISLSFSGIHHALIDYLETTNFRNTITTMEQEEIVEWAYKKNPIRQNDLFDDYMSDSLSETEAHEFLLSNDSDYRQQFKIKSLLLKLEEWNFNKTVDTFGSFQKDNPLYYKSLGNKEYLVFNHFNSKRIKEAGFDCWIAIFEKEAHLGLKRPLNQQSIKLSFDLNRDVSFIQKYVD